jgi:O-antigen/teichoic acid export membrane protein
MIQRIARLLRGEGIDSLLARGSAQSFLIQGTGALLLLVTEILTARLLGPQAFSVYSMAMAWVYILALLGTLGLNQALLKLVPAYEATGEWGLLRGAIRRANLWAGTATILLAIIAIGILWALGSCCMDKALVPVFLVAIAIIPVQVFSSLRQAVLRGLHRISSALAPEFILRPVLFGMALIAFSFWAGTPGAVEVLTFYLASSCVAFMVGVYLLQRSFPAEVIRHPAAYRDREWLAVALPLLIIVGLNLISTRIDIVMLGALSRADEVGTYAAASRVADIVVFGLAAANAVVAPIIARLYAVGDRGSLQQIVRHVAQGIALFTLPIALILTLFGKPILGLFGAGFEDGYAVLLVLLAGQIINALAGPVGYLMAMTGHQVKAMKIVAISAASNIVLNGVLIPMHGAIGAAVATAISVMIWNVMMLCFVRAELDLSPSLVPIRCRRK